MNEPNIESERSVTIFTDKFRIEGKISIFTGVRLTDYMNESKDFVAITDATVKDLTGRTLFQNEFINVNIASIHMVAPTDHPEVS